MRIFVATLCSGLVLILAGAAEAGYTRASLVGQYGCLGSGIDVVVAAPAGSAETVDGVSELIQLNLGTNGAITGSMVQSAFGERCKFTIVLGSTFYVNPDGTGSMVLKFAGSGNDPDSDQNCTPISGDAAHFDILVLGSGGKFDLQSSDDFMTYSHQNGDNDLNNPLKGSCEKQTPP